MTGNISRAEDFDTENLKIVKDIVKNKVFNFDRIDELDKLEEKAFQQNAVPYKPIMTIDEMMVKVKEWSEKLPGVITSQKTQVQPDTSRGARE